MTNVVRVINKNTLLEMEHPKRWFCALSILSVILVFLAMVIMFIVVMILLKVAPITSTTSSTSSSSSSSTAKPVTGTTGSMNSSDKSYEHRVEWQTCGGKCELDGYENPPLLIMSFDGFARYYLDRKEMKSLNSIAKCGARAERVMPSFPTKTFPNHYSIVTGLYPESHGITDNNVFDPTIYPIIQSMKSTALDAYFVGEPIWSVYKRKTNKPANCIFWVGCAHNGTGYAPDISPEYNQDWPFRNRIELVLDWLKLPKETRPGLITAYLHEPDNAGHYQFMSEDVDRMLDEIDDGLDYMMSQLKISGLLDCVNIAIVSDHGMELINKTYYFQDYIPDMTGIVAAKGVVSRLYINDTTNIQLNDLRDVFRCQIDDFKVNVRDDMPTRKHYAKTPKVGDVILEGPPGTCFYKSAADDDEYSGDHGYDFFNYNMHTVFFVRGPSIKENITVQTFQNVQYMNLWMDLLNISGTVETNGTVGYFDNILKNPPTRTKLTNNIKECASSGSDNYQTCGGSGTTNISYSNCSSMSEIPFYSSNFCYQSYCDNNLVLTNLNSTDSRIATIGIVSSLDSNSTSSTRYINTKYGQTCPTTTQNYSISIQPTGIANTYIDLPKYFVEKVYTPLQNLMDQYIAKFSKLFVISGTASDVNRDGLYDQGISTNITHLYRILVRCQNDDWEDLAECQDMKTLAFIFPIISVNNTWDCMTSSAILLDYTATIFDVEQISNLSFQLGNLTYHQNVLLRRNVTTNLWT